MHQSCILNSLKTGIWLEVQAIKDSFLTPLRLDLNMSKAHYQAELKNAQVKDTNKGERYSDRHILKEHPPFYVICPVASTDSKKVTKELNFFFVCLFFV